MKENHPHQAEGTRRSLTRRELIKRGIAAGVAAHPLFGLMKAYGETEGKDGGTSAYRFGKLSREWAGRTLNVSLVAEARADGIKSLANEFTNATGVKVNVNIYPYPTLQERQFTAVNQKTGRTDIVHADCVWMGQYAGQGWLHPVTEFVKQTDPQVLDLQDFIPKCLEEECMWENTLYGLPFITAVMTLFYRKDILEKHGAKPPETWEELRETAKKLHAEESKNGVSGLTMIAKRSSSLVCTHLDVFGCMGGYYYDSGFHPQMDSPEAITSVEFLKSLLPFCNDGVLAQDYDEAAAFFRQGRAAMNIHWQNAAPLFVGENSQITDTVAITKMPGVTKEGGIKRSPCIGGWNLGIVEDSKNKEAAWEFIVWATSKDLEKRLAKYGTGARFSTLGDPELGKRFIEYNATMEGLKEAAGRPRIPEWVEMQDLLAAEISNVLTGQSSAKDAMANANRAFQGVLKDRLKTG